MSLKKVLFLALLTISGTFYAQKNNFNLYSVKNGLPQNTVYKVFQDSKGYLWLGTDGGGVAKFDGRKYTYYNKNNGLAGNVVRDIIEDTKGTFWFATDEGVSMFNGKSFKNFSTSNGLQSDIIFDLFEDSEQRIWAGTSGGGVSVFEKKDSITVTSFTSNNGLASDNVFSILEDNFNRIWLGYIGGNPQMVNFDKELTVTEINTSFNYDLSTIFCGIKDSKGNIWYGSIKSGVFKYENISPNSNPTLVNYSILNGLKDNYILNLCERNNTICIGTNDGGIQFLENNTFSYLDVFDGLPNNQILNLFNDRENNLWISCMGEGLLKLNGFNFSHFTKNDGLISNQISSIKKNEHDNLYWVSTYDNGIQTFSIKDNKIINQQKILSNHPFYSSIKTFDFDNNNNVWIGTQNGLVVWNEKILATVNSEEELAGDQINTIYCAKNDWVWIGTSSGLSFYTGDMFGVFTEDEGFIHNEIQTIIEDSEGTIWIGTLGGLASYKDNSMTTYDEAEGLTNLKVHALVEDKKGNILIGTYGGGIFLLDKKKPKNINPILYDKQLTSNNIYSLSIYENQLMVGTDKGFDKVTFGKNNTIHSIQHYSENNGFLSIENNLNAIYSDIDNKQVLFGTVNGLSIYTPYKETSDSKQPTILLVDIKLFNQTVDWKIYSTNLNQDGIPTQLELPYNKNFLTFNFSTIFFTNPNNITYQYQLVGSTDEWYSTKNNEVVFQGLEPNTYTLKVKSITENGEESVPYEYSFTIAPPFYLTWWFFTLCIVVSLIVVYVYTRVRLSKLKKDKIVLENTVKERTKEIVQQKEVIEEKNKEIVDSINYAQRIQSAILPPQKQVEAHLPESFILYQPKDIVAGDFYWMETINEETSPIILFAAADCTGHGVPGAMVSVVCNNALNRSVREHKLSTPGEILTKTREIVIQEFEKSDEEVKDGMDIALCSLQKSEEKWIVKYAGANNPLWIVRKNAEEIEEIKADKQPIGKYAEPKPFTTHTIELNSGDAIYMFSDGYADQFGGEKGKKYKSLNFKRFIISIQENDMNRQKMLISEEIKKWMHPFDNQHFEQIDDILVTGIKIH